MLHFKQFERPDYEFKEAVKKPVKIKCIQMQEAFTVETLEGTMNGKAGDWLMVGVSGELYPCDHEIFLKSYDLID
ncbi:MAG: hypothetical protein HKN00_06570 [Flavobacteriaceae bacterium]|nr:PGDYG domain-containing protein [Bacteroidia bacterium]MBT8288539.1 PGDYG domain-containing protein [Bacteroidia bacterium]NNF74829.1 hypothetical protein [Flavobacteriaceae bacterium]NNK72312.1 hypothetical protein [Flavobacteriaceae bacterium]